MSNPKDPVMARPGRLRLPCRSACITGSARDYLPGFAWLAGVVMLPKRTTVRIFMHPYPRDGHPHLPLRARLAVGSPWSARALAPGGDDRSSHDDPGGVCHGR
jgi:hypothetical protein